MTIEGGVTSSDVNFVFCVYELERRFPARSVM